MGDRTGNCRPVFFFEQGTSSSIERGAKPKRQRTVRGSCQQGVEVARMWMESDSVYFFRRAQQEREAARRASIQTRVKHTSPWRADLTVCPKLSPQKRSSGERTQDSSIDRPLRTAGSKRISFMATPAMSEGHKLRRA